MLDYWSFKMILLVKIGGTNKATSTIGDVFQIRPNCFDFMDPQIPALEQHLGSFNPGKA
jgi:hypothetical protein